MKIRDGHATINGDGTTYDFESDCIEIVADDGRPLFDIELKEDGSLFVSASIFVKHNGELLGTKPVIIPHASNCFYVKRQKYDK